MQNHKQCDMCKQMKPNVEAQPSRKQLLFGGFNLKTENRCSACERRVSRWVARQLNQQRED